MASEKQQIEFMWRDLGSPRTPGEYLLHGQYVQVTAKDIEQARGNPRTECTAIRVIYQRENEPFLITNVTPPSAE